MSDSVKTSSTNTSTDFSTESDKLVVPRVWNEEKQRLEYNNTDHDSVRNTQVIVTFKIGKYKTEHNINNPCTRKIEKKTRPENFIELISFQLIIFSI